MITIKIKTKPFKIPINLEIELVGSINQYGEL